MKLFSTPPTRSFGALALVLAALGPAACSSDNATPDAALDTGTGTDVRVDSTAIVDVGFDAGFDGTIVVDAQPPPDTGFVTDTGTDAGVDVAVDGGAAVEVTGDPQVAAVVAAADTGEINAATYALTRAADSRVRDFAQMMVTDHTALMTAAMTVLTAQGITPQSSPLSAQVTADNAAALQALQTAPAAVFDRTYVNGQVSAHQQVLATMDLVLLPAVTNAAFRAALTSARARVAMHLDMARQLQLVLTSVASDGGVVADGGTVDGGPGDAGLFMTNAPNAQMATLLGYYVGLHPQPVYVHTAPLARVQPSMADAVRAELTATGRSTAPMAVGSVVDRTIPGPTGAPAIPVRIYTPAGVTDAGTALPLVVYFHGGGFVVATIDTYDSSCRALANAAQAIVMSVEYRKAPENPFPAAAADAYAAYQWALANAATVGADPARVAVAGESAGGNLATGVTIRAHMNGVAQPVHQLLVYPLTTAMTLRPAYVENQAARPLDTPAVVWFGDRYLSSLADATNPLLAVESAPLAGLAPATVITAQIDPLRDDGEAYAAALQAAGVSVQVRRFDGVTHEFFGTGAVVDAANDAVAFAGQRLRAAFAP